MSSEHFIKYLKNPKLLDQVTYEELSQMREKYPYSHILHYLLFLKSQHSPADMAEHNKNASIFAVDNNKLFEEIKEFQELEQQPTEKLTMDDLFDLSDDEKEASAIQNKLTPTNDSENAEDATPPLISDEKIAPRIIREQRYIPLDPKIYGTREAPKEENSPTPDVPNPKPTSEKPTPDTKSNVLFIDALINLDSNNDRIELVSNKDAYKEITDTPIFESENQNVDNNIAPEIIEEVSEEIPVQKIEIPLEVTNDTEPPEIVDPFSINDEDEVAPEVFDESINEVVPVADSGSETKKSFDKWVRKKDVEKGRKKSVKKKKKKKDKMPLNAKESLKETDIMASETLAELLVKQGRNKKAIKVYERLCLIFPQKSNYFAQIIKNLKEKS